MGDKNAFTAFWKNHDLENEKKNFPGRFCKICGEKWNGVVLPSFLMKGGNAPTYCKNGHLMFPAGQYWKP